MNFRDELELAILVEYGNLEMAESVGVALADCPSLVGYMLFGLEIAPETV